MGVGCRADHCQDTSGSDSHPPRVRKHAARCMSVHGSQPLPAVGRRARRNRLPRASKSMRDQSRRAHRCCRGQLVSTQEHLRLCESVEDPHGCSGQVGQVKTRTMKAVAEAHPKQDKRSASCSGRGTAESQNTATILLCQSSSTSSTSSYSILPTPPLPSWLRPCRPLLICS